MMKKWQIMLLAALTAMLLLVAGCDPQNEKSAAQDGASSAASQATSSTGSTASADASGKSGAKKQGSRTITVYFPDDNGMKLLGEQRTISAQTPCQSAVEELLAGPQQKGESAIFPRHVKLLSAEVKDGVAKVNFSRELKQDFVGGSTGEEMLVGSLVNTLTQLDGVKKVQILVEGKPIESLSGHLDLSVPVGPMKNLLK